MIKRVVRAVDWVVENAHKPAVVNLSLNTDGDQPELTAAVKRLVDAGLIVVASAGNGGENACGHAPGGTPVGRHGDRLDQDRSRCRTELRAVRRPLRAGQWGHLGGGPGAESEPAGQERPGRHLLGRTPSQRCRRPVPVHAPEASPQQVRRWMIDNATTGVIRGDRRGTPNRLLYSR